MNASERGSVSPARGILAFAPLCAVAAAHWAQLLVGPPVARIAAVVAVATGCGLVLALTARLEPHGRFEARIVRVATVIVSVLAGLLAVGVPAALLSPTGWGDLATGLGRGSADLPDRWPYGGGDIWVRRTVLAAIPAMVVPAAAFALWPAATGPGGREAAAVRRVGALALLLSLIGFAGSERPVAHPIVEGALLLVALVAWLYVPRVRTQATAAFAAGATVLVAALASLPVVSALDPTPRSAERPPRQAPQKPRASADKPQRDQAPSSRRERRAQRERERAAVRERRRNPPERSKGAGDREPRGGVSVLVVLAIAAALVAIAVLVVRRARRRRGKRSAWDEAVELRSALERLGWSVPAQTTLTELEGLLDRRAGPVAARYAQRLRERRFASPTAAAASPLDRRGLREALTAGHGPAVRVRGLIALPPAALVSRR